MKKSYTQKQWLHIIEEILPITKFLLDCFGIQLNNDVVDFVKKCFTCQKQGSSTLKTKSELHSMHVPTAVMNKNGVDIWNLPKVDGYCCLVVCIDYFSKWSEAKPYKDKKATTVSQFLYELISRHGCFSIQMNDQGREFVNSVSVEFYRLTGIIQRVTSAYYPHANGLVERQNRIIENLLTKVLDSNPTGQPYVIEVVLEKQPCRVTLSTIQRIFQTIWQRYIRHSSRVSNFFNKPDLS